MALPVGENEVLRDASKGVGDFDVSAAAGREYDGERGTGQTVAF